MREPVARCSGSFRLRSGCGRREGRLQRDRGTAPGRPRPPPRSLARAILRHHDGGIADVEVHVARRDRRRRPRRATRPGEGRVTTSSRASRAAAARHRVDRLVGIVPGRRRDRDPSRRHEAREIVDVAVGVVVEQARAEPDDALEAEIARAAAARSRSRVRALRLGLSRHCSVVTTVPEPSPSIAPPSRTQSALAKGRPARFARAARRCPRRRRGRTCRPSR